MTVYQQYSEEKPVRRAKKFGKMPLYMLFCTSILYFILHFLKIIYYAFLPLLYVSRLFSHEKKIERISERNMVLLFETNIVNFILFSIKYFWNSYSDFLKMRCLKFFRCWWRLLDSGERNSI